MQAGRKFMQVHEPIWKWCEQRTKNSIITIPRFLCEKFRFLCAALCKWMFKRILMQFLALLGKISIKNQTWTSTPWQQHPDFVAVKRWWNRCVWLNAIFHELLMLVVNIQMRGRGRWKCPTDLLGFRVQNGNDTRSHSERNWIFYYLMQLLSSRVSHILIIRLQNEEWRVKESGRESAFNPEAI